MKLMGTVLFSVAMAWLALGPLTAAEPKAKEEPDGWEHYIVEFAAGTFASFAGGALGYWIVISSVPDSLAPMSGFFYGIPIGCLIGGSAGVIGTGWILGDEGNVLLTVLGAAVGAYVGLYGAASTHLLSCNSESIMVISAGIATAIPATLGAMIGYNLGK